MEDFMTSRHTITFVKSKVFKPYRLRPAGLCEETDCRDPICLAGGFQDLSGKFAFSAAS